MVDVESFIESVLSHGESRYDPVKAHEYYLKTRELKGRRSTSELRTKSKKEGWAYTKNKVEEERKQALETAAESNKQAVTQLRTSVQGRRDEIREKLRAVMERLTNESKTERERIAKETEAAIAALPEMPKGLNKAQAAEFAAKRREEIARIRGDAAETRAKYGEAVKYVRGVERGKLADERTKVSEELKSSVAKARDRYKSAREAIKAKYETELDREYESIRANV